VIYAKRTSIHTLTVCIDGPRPERTLPIKACIVPRIQLVVPPAWWSWHDLLTFSRSCGRERDYCVAKEELSMVGHRPSILFVACTPLEGRPSTGVDQRMRILFDGLASIGDVHVHQPEPAGRASLRRDRPLGSLRDDATRTAVLHPNLGWHRPETPTARRFRALRPEQFDVVFLHRLGASWWTGWTDPERTILDIDDVPSQILLDRIRFGTSLKRIPREFLFRWVRHCERRALDAFRFGLVCSEDDRRYLNHPHVTVVPNAFYVSPGEPVPECSEGTGSMLFVGSLGYPPNPEGLEWFVREVLPRIRAQLPQATLTVVGRTPRRGTDHFKWRSESGVRLIGEVESIAPHIHDCQLEVCPLIRGQGTRIKILESLVHGKPVVSTTVGAYGIDVGEEHGILRRDDPDSFAAACIRLLSNPVLRAAVAERGRKWVLENASPEATKRRLEALVGTVLSERGQTLR